MTCEDAIAATDDLLAVIDGSTSKTPFRLFPDETNGHAAARLVKAYIEQGARAESTCEEFCEGVTRYLGSAIMTACQGASIPAIEEQSEYSEYSESARRSDSSEEILSPELRPTCSAVVFSKKRRELWLIGDCQALADGEHIENGKAYEAEIAEERAQLIRQGMAPKEARRAIEPKLVRAMLSGQNKTYAVIDGTPIYMKGVKVIPIPENAKEVVLASDGYPFLRPTLEDSERALSEQIARDPQCIDTFIATKGLVEGNDSFDDRTYVRIAL